MITSYIKIAFRTLWRNKFYALINIFGLSVAVGCCIVAYLNFQYNNDFDAFHKNADSIYRVESIRTINGTNGVWGIVPLPLGAALKKDFASVIGAVQFSDAEATVQSGDKVFNEEIRYADDGFFDMFSFPLLEGSKDALKRGAILSEQYAVKYFGDEDPIGKQLQITYGNGERQLVMVEAVAEKIPGNSSIKFDILLSSRNLVEAHIDDPGNWAHWTSALFVQMRNPADITLLRKSSDRYVAMQVSANPTNPISSLKFEPLKNVAETSREVRGNSLWNGAPPSSIGGPIIVSVLLLLMACFNYVNTSIAISAKRMKEIGVRKVLGGGRTQLVRQFLGENIVIVIISMFFALGIAELLVPGFRNLLPFVEIELHYLQNFRLLLFLLFLLMATAILAGAYPAYYITGYRPAALLKGIQKVGKSTVIMRLLLASQFVLSMVAVGTGIVFAQNARYQETMDVGYHMDRLAFVYAANSKQCAVYQHALEQNKAIERVASSRSHVFFSSVRRIVHAEEKPLEAQVLNVGFDYMETVGFRLKQGRFFDRKHPSDASTAIITQKTVDELGWKEALGKTIEIDSTRYSVIGVVEDFYNAGVWSPIAPVVFRLADPSTFNFVVARLSEPQSSIVTATLRQVWKDHFPDVPYYGFYQDHAMEEGISVSQSITSMFVFIGAVALIISIMGLFAMVSLGVARRTKEIGVRKVLGAGLGNLLNLLNRELVVILVLSAIAADMLGYFAAKTFVSLIYAYHTPIGIEALLIANFVVLIVGISTALLQTLRVATANPVEALRYE